MKEIQVQNPLFLIEQINDDFRLFAALDVPVNLDYRISPKGVGIVGSNGFQTVSWSRVREMSSGIVFSADESLRFGSSADILRIEGETSGIECPCFITEKSQTTKSYEINVRVHCESMFETAGVQAYLWLASYAGFKYPDFMGSIDQKFLERTELRTFAPRDVMLVEVLAPSRICAVLELIEPIAESQWKAILHSPNSTPVELQGLDIFSIAQTGIDGHSAVFRRLFASVLAD